MRRWRVPLRIWKYDTGISHTQPPSTIDMDFTFVLNMNSMANVEVLQQKKLCRVTELEVSGFLHSRDFKIMV